MRPARNRRDLASAAGAAFTFIAPRGFHHPKTRAHARLLGPCFKTGRMDPYVRQRPKGAVGDHHANDRPRLRSTASSPPRWTAGRRDGTPARRGAPCKRGPRSGPGREGKRAITAGPWPPGEGGEDPAHLPGTFQTQSPTDVDARPREVRRPGGTGRGAAVRSDPRAPGGPGRPAESRRAHC